MHLVQEFQLLAIYCCIFFVSANPSLEGYQCTGGNKWKIAKFDKIYCYTKVQAPAAKNEAVISNNFCKQHDGAAHPASIHSMAENNFLENAFTNGFIGLFQPGYGGYNPGSYRWEDGTPLNFINWDRGFHLRPQPNNDRPIERLTKLRKNRKFHGWHDWFAGGLDYVICKKPATKIPVATTKATTTQAVTIATTHAQAAKPLEFEDSKSQPLDPAQIVDPPKKASADNQKNVKIVENTYVIDTDPKRSQSHGGSILSCNTVKCRGGHKCIMTKDECQVPHKSDPFAPTNCASKPRCVPDKICKACGPNEHRSRCSGCEQTCEDPNRKQCKKENICAQNSRCVCDSGFVRNSAGKCVNVLKCPNAPNGVETTTIPEEFIIISKKERNEKHEQIDLLKPRTTINPRSNSPNGNPNHSSKKPVGSKDKPDDGFIIVKEKQNKHRPDGSNQNPTSKPGKKPPKDKSTTQKPNDDGFIIVKEKGNKQKPDGSNPNRTSKPGKNSPKDNKPDKPDDGFIIVKEKGNMQTKRPSENQQNSPTKPTEKPDDGFIVVHEKRKNHHQPSEIKDDEFFVSKKKVQNNKHEQINLM